MTRIAFILPALALLAACGGGGSATGGSRDGPADRIIGSPSALPSWGRQPTGTALSQEDNESRILGPNEAGHLVGMGRIRGARWPVSRDPEPINPNNGLPPRADPEEAPPTLRFNWAMTCEEGPPIACEGTPQHAPGSDPARAGPNGGLNPEYGLSDAQWSSQIGNNRLVVRDPSSGIELMEAHQRYSSPSPDSRNMRAWGAWLDHSGFAVLTEWSREAPLEGEQWGYATAWTRALFAGNETGSRPQDIPGRATWRGGMTGMDMGGVAWTPLVGQATLTWRPANNVVDAAFTGIESLVGGRWTRRPDIASFSNVPVGPGGRFAWNEGTPDAFGTVDTGNYIRGAFFGPDHVEAAGIFERGGIIGAFGANRQ